MRPTLVASIIIVIGASAWGVYWIPVREIEGAGIEGGWAVALFNLPALAIAAIVARFLPAPPPETRRLIFLVGVLAGAGLAFYATGLVLTTVVRATLLFYLMPIWATLLAILVLGERPTKARWIALALGLAGLALTLGASLRDIIGGFGPGEALGLASGVLWALATIIIRHIGEVHGSSQAINTRLVLHQYVWVIVFAAAAAWLAGAPAPELDEAANAIAGLALPLSIIILISLYALFWAVGRISPGRSGLLMMSEVVVAVISAAILLPEEAMNAREWLGAALIVSAGVVEVLGGDPSA